MYYEIIFGRVCITRLERSNCQMESPLCDTSTTRSPDTKGLRLYNILIIGKTMVSYILCHIVHCMKLYIAREGNDFHVYVQCILLLTFHQWHDLRNEWRIVDHNRFHGCNKPLNIYAIHFSISRNLRKFWNIKKKIYFISVKKTNSKKLFYSTLNVTRKKFLKNHETFSKVFTIFKQFSK